MRTVPADSFSNTPKAHHPPKVGSTYPHQQKKAFQTA